MRTDVFLKSQNIVPIFLFIITVLLMTLSNSIICAESHLKLNDKEYLSSLLGRAVEASNATVIKTILHQFSPQGVSGVVILAESHLAVHTWPEFGYAAIEIFTCGEDTHPEKGHEYLLDKLSPEHHEVKVLMRGDLALINRFPVPGMESFEGQGAQDLAEACNE